MRRNQFVEPRMPVASHHTDIELWTLVTIEAFSPFVRRRKILIKDRDIFRTELVNLLPILDHPQFAQALMEAVRMSRRAIYSDPASSHAYQIEQFPENCQADSRWLSLAAFTNPLPLNGDLADRATQLMTILDGVIEGCLKPRIVYLFGFAHRLDRGVFPQRSYDLGECIAQWPGGLTRGLRRAMIDPIFGLPISQWRNIAAHRSYSRVGADIFEATYGKRVKTTIQFSFSQIEAILEWAKLLLAVCRMANVIVDLEFMNELRRLGLQDVPIRFDAFMIILSHNLRMVGFTYDSEELRERRLAVYYRNDLDRKPVDALIHASQVLDQLAMAATSDIALREVVDEVQIGLVDLEGQIYASAAVTVDAALRSLDRRLSMEKYIAEISFWFAPELDHVD